MPSGTSRVILCVVATLWLPFVVRVSRDVSVESIGPVLSDRVESKAPRLQLSPAVRPISAAPARPAITLDEGAAGQEMRRLRDRWQHAVLLK